MAKDNILLSHHITRYCRPNRDLLDDNKIGSVAFELRENESYISVHWLEFYLDEVITQEEQLKKIYNFQVTHPNPKKKFTPSSTGLYAVLNKKHTITQIKKIAEITLLIKQVIEINENIDCHSGIYGIKELETAWIDLITEELAVIANSKKSKKFLVSDIKKIKI